MMKYLLCVLGILASGWLHGQDFRGLAERRQPFVGTWQLVSVENSQADGSKSLPYGEHPVGLLVFTKGGEYALQILKAGRPKVVAGDKSKATAEENLALVQGSNSHFGRYSTDPYNHTICFYVQHAFYPNWDGYLQTRSYRIEKNILSYVVTNTTSGGSVTAKVVWKRKGK